MFARPWIKRLSSARPPLLIEEISFYFIYGHNVRGGFLLSASFPSILLLAFSNLDHIFQPAFEPRFARSSIPTFDREEKKETWKLSIVPSEILFKSKKKKRTKLFSISILLINLHNWILEWKKTEISFSFPLDEETIKSAISSSAEVSFWIVEHRTPGARKKRNIRVGRMQPVRHENCYSRAGAGTGAHKLRIRCFTCHIPANRHISVRSSCHVHTNESRPGPGWSVSNRTREFRSNISPEAVTFYPRFRVTDNVCDTFGKSPALEPLDRVFFHP